MDRKKTLILVGLGVVLVVVVCMRFLAGSHETGDTASASAVGRILDPRASSELDEDPQHLATVARIARLHAGTRYESGEGDPMRPLVGARTSSSDEENRGAAEPQAAPASLPPMSLYGIVWDSTTPIALIDGHDVRVGDTVKGARVIEIGMDRVVLTFRSRQFVLTVE